MEDSETEGTAANGQIDYEVAGEEEQEGGGAREREMSVIRQSYYIMMLFVYFIHQCFFRQNTPV